MIISTANTHIVIVPLISFILHWSIIDALKPPSIPPMPSRLANRRDAIRKVVATALLSDGIAASAASPGFAMEEPSTASSPDDGVTATSLLSTIPRMDFDAPATNATIPSNLSNRIEDMASSLESTTINGKIRRDYATSPQLAGSWRLLYSNGPEITNLASRLPFGFVLGPTYQPLDTSAGRFENRGNVLHRYGLAKLQTNVVGDIRVSPTGSLNSVGVRNDRNNRVIVDFRCIVFQLDEVLGKPVSFRKVLMPKLDPRVEDDKAPPANDVTYLDDAVRIVRGGDGALFVFERAQVDNGRNKSMLTSDERDALFHLGGDDNAVVVGGNRENLKGQPELNFLFQKDRSREK